MIYVIAAGSLVLLSTLLLDYLRELQQRPALAYARIHRVRRQPRS
jgi:hypothetical protein